MDEIILSNGVKMPRLGLGTFMIGNNKECENVVTEALNLGYRLIDTAAAYENEEYIGKAIKNSNIPREEIFLTTKVWYRSYEQDKCEKSIYESLKRLKTDYIDLLLLHWPFGNTYAAWRVLEKFYRQGTLRSIGVSNFTPAQILDLRHFNEISPMVNQVELSLCCQQNELREYMGKIGIAVQGYAPFGEGRYNFMFESPILKNIAMKYKKSIYQIALRFILQGGVCSIPKSASVEHLKDNIEIFDFELEEEEIESLRKLDENKPLIMLQNDAMAYKFFA